MIAAVLAAMFCMTVPVMASTSVVVNDDVTVEQYDWSADWDANQNNAYVDIISGILSGQTEISVRNDYVTSGQFMNVVRRISEDCSVWEAVYFKDVTYTDDGYADTVTMEYNTKYSIAEIRTYLSKVADYAAFGRSFIDPTMTDLEKALFLHDFIGQRTLYEENDNPLGMASGVYLDNLGVCRNIGTAYDQLLYSVQVPFGGATGNEHGWTNIYIDGKWYVSDATFDTFTTEERVKYTSPQNDYFLCGTEKHFEENLYSVFESVETIGYLVENVEHNNPTAYWDFTDCLSNIAYHVDAGESHGKLYYLSAGTEYG